MINNKLDIISNHSEYDETIDWSDHVVKLNIKLISIDFNVPLDKTNIETGSGTGFFISSNLILTAYHVVKYSINIEIVYKQTNIYNGKILYVFPDDDLAIIIIEENIDTNIIEFININNDTYKLITVYTIGYPLKSDSVIKTKGIISGLRNSLLQTDAPLNPGNSGGPLVMYDTTKNKWFILGINVSKLAKDVQNTNFVIPIYRFIILWEYLINFSIDNIVIKKPLWDLEFQLIKQQELRKHLFKNHDFYITNKYGIRIININKQSYLTNYIDINDVLISINDNYIDINGFIKFDFIPEKISIKDLYYWFIPNDVIKVKFLNTKTDTIDDIDIILEYNNIKFNFYLIDGYPSYYIESGDLIFSIFSQQHYDNIFDLNFTFKQLSTIYYRYKNNYFIVYLSNINPKLYKTSLFNKFPIGDIIIEINDTEFNNYEEFILLMDKPIEKIKTLEGKIYFIGKK
jgi:hypothetical protein